MVSTMNRAVAGGLMVALLVAGPIGLATWSVRNIEIISASQRIGYRLDDVRQARQPVPNIYLSRLPAELPNIGSARERKSLFIRIILPLVLRVNEDILADRQRLNTLIEHLAAGHELRPRDSQWLADLGREYRVNDGDLIELLNRVNIIPPSLALAQAAIESGWGTSRFAQQGNALYGQWTYGGNGIVPSRREVGRAHEIKAFPRLLESVSEYARNLNTHAAYGDFRAIRAQLAHGTAGPTGMRLAETLVGYSQRGANYVADLRTIILSNRLVDFDRTALQKGT